MLDVPPLRTPDFLGKDPGPQDQSAGHVGTRPLGAWLLHIMVFGAMGVQVAAGGLGKILKIFGGTLECC